MRVCYFSSETEIINLMEKDKSIEELTVVDRVPNISDVLVIDEKELSPEELVQVNLENHHYVFYRITNPNTSYAQIKALYGSRGIYILSEYLTGEQIIETVKETVNPHKRTSMDNVVTFFSTNSNIGTTSTTLSVGKALAEGSDLKVGVLLLNAWDAGTDTFEHDGNHLDDIKGRLSSQSIMTNEEFFSMFHMEDKDRLYILAGNRNTKLERLYSKEEISYLIDKAKSHFDVVVIDAGSHFDNANIIQSLYQSDLRILMSNQQVKTQRRFQQLYKDVLNPLGFSATNDFLMVLNNYSDEAYLNDSKIIQRESGVRNLTHIPHNPNGMIAEMEKHILYTYNEPAYREAIRIIAFAIGNSFDLDIEFEETGKRKTIFGFKQS